MTDYFTPLALTSQLVLRIPTAAFINHLIDNVIDTHGQIVYDLSMTLLGASGKLDDSASLTSASLTVVTLVLAIACNACYYV